MQCINLYSSPVHSTCKNCLWFQPRYISAVNHIKYDILLALFLPVIPCDPFARFISISIFFFLYSACLCSAISLSFSIRISFSCSLIFALSSFLVTVKLRRLLFVPVGTEYCFK
ncbi:hypothetical protein PMAYCL1PPCAC_15174 [Pristionchus mayeri]|uniref:Uncharacterized protein n=1 Tax=Pristionchus mayeri TaxID=1317129 RepID=A0AAN5CIC4_9BILA|nr:hypothetical protein PMAYCL1PPCAC_15174 [Pristionchus mayeri]